MYFTKARREIQKRIELKLGSESAQLRTQHNSLVSIVNQALGGSTKPSGAINKKDDVTSGAKSPEDAIAAINKMLKF